MILAIKSDASYLSVAKGRSGAAGYFFLTNTTSSPTGLFKPNCAVHILCQIMRELLSSVAEAELDALFHNGKEACPLRIALEEMGNPQPATPIATDNNTASGITTDTVKQKRSKAIYMQFYGSATAYAKATSRFFGSKVGATALITIPSIIPAPIIKPSDRVTYICLRIHPRTILIVLPMRIFHLLFLHRTPNYSLCKIQVILVRVCC